MHRKKIAHEDLISWLKYLDVEYLSGSEADLLSVFNINDQEQRRQVFMLAVLPEFDALNDVSKKSMLAILENALKASEQELQDIFNRVSMPFTDEVLSRKLFLQSLNEVISEKQV